MKRNIHGVSIPNRKKKRRKKIATLTYILTGTVPSKKNEQAAWVNRGPAFKRYATIIKSKGSLSREDFVSIVSELRPYIRPGENFKKWHVEAKASIQAQQKKIYKSLVDRGIVIEFPASNVSIRIYHYWKDDLIRDNSNKAETIHDLMVDCGILAGDNWQVLTPNEADADLYKGEIVDHITEISLTVYEPTPENVTRIYKEDRIK